ncbi:MAG: DoxX family protein [Alphaproteobacteria bacterium]|nr:DoxX family protein [Alphaproteobacteria bacterium]
MPLIISAYQRFLHYSDVLRPVLLLVVRIYIAKVFFMSGLVKIDDFSNTVALFADEYQVPLLPPYLAAVLGTMFELACPVLLVLGLATRAATLPLLAMTAVIQFTYDQNIQHAYWAMLLATILVSGAGRFSIDYYIRRKYAQA